MKRLLALLLVFALTAACSDDTDGETTGGNNTAANNVTNPFISGTVTGDIDGTFELVGVFKCQSTGIPGQSSVAELVATGDTQQVSIFLPYSSGGEETFQLIGVDDDPATVTDRQEISYRAPDLTNFDNGTGTLTVTAWPTAAGEPIEATFDASLTNGDSSQNIQVTGTIQGTAPDFGFEDCE